MVPGTIYSQRRVEAGAAPVRVSRISSRCAESNRPPKGWSPPQASREGDDAGRPRGGSGSVRLRRSACPGDRIARPDLENPSALFAVATRRPRGWVGGGKRCSVGQIILGEAVIVLSVAGVVLLVAFHWHSLPSHSVYPRTSNATDQPECRNGPIRRVGREHAQTHRPENIPLSRAGRLASRVPRRPRRHARRRASACDPGRSAPKAVAPRVQSSR